MWKTKYSIQHKINLFYEFGFCSWECMSAYVLTLTHMELIKLNYLNGSAYLRFIGQLEPASIVSIAMLLNIIELSHGAWA